jgi:hypothetical protein
MPSRHNAQNTQASAETVTLLLLERLSRKNLTGVFGCTTFQTVVAVVSRTSPPKQW